MDELRTWLVAEHGERMARFQGQVAATVPRERWRELVDEGGSSLAWLVFHGALHADVALHALLLGVPPLVDRAGLGIAGSAPEAGLGEADDRSVSESIRLDHLETYAAAVDAAVGHWLATADTAFADPVPLDRLERLAGVREAAVPWLYRLWSGRDIGWLVRWELLGHPQGHVGEMISLRSRLGLDPF